MATHTFTVVVHGSQTMRVLHTGTVVVHGSHTIRVVVQGTWTHLVTHS